jgi:hypothetical protein
MRGSANRRRGSRNAWVQAWPASLTRCDGSMPIFDSARSYF